MCTSFGFSLYFFLCYLPYKERNAKIYKTNADVEITEISVIKSERGDDMVQGPGRTDEKQKEPQNGTDKT